MFHILERWYQLPDSRGVSGRADENQQGDQGVCRKNDGPDQEHSSGPEAQVCACALAYNKEPCDRDQIELDVSRKAGKTPCVGQSLNKFIDYNNLVNLEVSLAYPTSHDQLLDLNIKLAMKVQNTSSTIHGKSHKTVKCEFCDSNNPKDKTLMNDRTRLDYFVSIIMWVKRNYESETRKKMTLNKVPAKKNWSKVNPLLQLNLL